MKKKNAYRDLKERLDVPVVLADLLGEPGVGGNYHCPRAEEDHERGTDSKPSLSVSDDGKAYCHACGMRASNVVGLVQELEGVEFEDAIRSLWSEYVSPLVPSDELARAERGMNELRRVQLLERRGLDSGTVSKYSLGWRGGRLWIPIFDANGLCVDVRRHDTIGQHDIKILSYKKGFGAARIYPESAMRADSLVLCEGELDALLLNQHRCPAVTITSGARTMPDELAERFRGKSVLVVGDNDKAGRAGALKRQAALKRAGATVAIAELPVSGTGEDVTDWILKYGGNPDEIWALGGDAVAEVRVNGADSAAALDLTDKETELIAMSEDVLLRLEHEGVFYRHSEGAFFKSKSEEFGVPSGEFARFLCRLDPKINSATSNGRFIINHITSRADAKAIPEGSWSHFESPYTVHIHQPDNRMLRIRPGRVRRLRNPTSSLVMTCSRDALSFSYDRGVNVTRAFDLMWEHVASNLACSLSNRLLVMSWTLSAFLRGFVRSKPQLRFLAPSGSGKSTATKLLSHFILGDEMLLSPETTIAAAYAESTREPIVVWDNLEEVSLKRPGLNEYFLIAATGGQKSKRRDSTTQGVVHDRVDSLILTNGIEAYSKAELISRTAQVRIDADMWGSSDFSESAAVATIREHRDEMLSAVVKAIAGDVLPRIEDGEHRRIASEIDPHSMSRFDEYLSLMALILDATFLTQAAGAGVSNREVFNSWVHGQQVASEDMRVETDPIVDYLELLYTSHNMLEELESDVVETETRFKVAGQPRALFHDFEALARRRNRRLPWESVATFGRRMADSKATIEAAGWSFRRYRSGGRVKYRLARRK